MLSKMSKVKLGDFGISKQLSNATTFTKQAGSVYYAPPEQLEGAKPHITGDVYSLGLVLYYALVGREEVGSLVRRNLETSLKEALPWERVRVAAVHLLQHLLIEDPQKRAWFTGHEDTYVLAFLLAHHAIETLRTLTNTFHW
jgi:serine/threonine-protein kinase